MGDNGIVRSINEYPGIVGAMLRHCPGQGQSPATTDFKINSNLQIPIY